MKRLCSILLLSGMLMAPTLSYSNQYKDNAIDVPSSASNYKQYKDLAIGTIKGINTVTLVTLVLNVASNIYNKHTITSWLPDPMYLAGILGSIVIGTTPKNDTEKDGHLMGSVGAIATIASIVAWNLYKK